MIAWLSLPFVFFGHLAICCAVYNRTHASAVPRGWRKAVEKLIVLAVLGGLAGFAWARWRGFDFDYYSLTRSPVYFGYETGCLAVLLTVAVVWIIRTSTSKRRYLLEHSVERHSVENTERDPLLLSWDAKLLGGIPFNQSTKIWVEHKSLALPNLPIAFDGFKICQLSDLHFTGKLGQPYFAELVELANQQSPDLVCVTGDIVDTDECIDWIETILAKLEAKHGMYYVLGNHDRRIRDLDRLRRQLSDAGFVFAPPKWRTHQIGCATLFVAGNEIPWFKGAESLSAFERKTENEFSLLLSHSPDQFDFACDRNVDLMLAGHTHGGQICFPLIGPIIAPSRYGIKFAAQPLFRKAHTTMHVTRGIAGDDIIRINCAPELAVLTLKRA